MTKAKKLASFAVALGAIMSLAACGSDYVFDQLGQAPPGSFTVGGPSEVDPVEVDRAYANAFRGCNLTPEQDARLRPEFRAWAQGMADVFRRNPALAFRLLGSSEREAEALLGRSLGPVHERYSNTLQSTLSPDQIACFQRNGKGA